MVGSPIQMHIFITYLTCMYHKSTFIIILEDNSDSKPFTLPNIHFKTEKKSMNSILNVLYLVSLYLSIIRTNHRSSHTHGLLFVTREFMRMFFHDEPLCTPKGANF